MKLFGKSKKKKFDATLNNARCIYGPPEMLEHYNRTGRIEMPDDPPSPADEQDNENINSQENEERK